MNVTWLIQTNLINEQSARQVWDSAKEAGCRVQEAIVVPFQDELDNEADILSSNLGQVVIPYGSCKLTRLAQQQDWLGNCYDETTFRADVWLQHRSDMLNSDVQFMTVGDANSVFENTPRETLKFIRPLHDLKEFAGTVTTVEEIRKWMKSTDSGNFSFTADTQIMVAPVQEIFSEARFFIVGGKVIDGSYYRQNGQLKSKHIEDSHIYNAIQKMADQWLPHTCCVMDVADTENGLKCIEFNTINSSGFYDHDIKKIVHALSDWASNLTFAKKHKV